MTDIVDAAGGEAKAPWHLWVIGGVTLLWNLVGLMDFTMTLVKFEPYMSQFSEEQLAYFYGFPLWVVVFWALGVFGSVLGSVFLLLRRRLAVHAFALWLLCMIVTTIFSYGVADGMKVTGPGALVFSIIIFAVAVALLFYARAMVARGVLR